MSLEISHLSKTHEGDADHPPVRIFSDITCRVNAGRFLSIVGPSGCGKTTLLRIVAGLERASGGRVLLDGEAVRGRDPRIGLVFQEFALFPWRTAIRNVEMGLEIAGIPPDERRAAAMEYIRAFDLEGFENAYPKTLSGGMKQRVAIARTLILNPRVVLMDEPFGSLDSQTRNDLQNFLMTLWTRRRDTILFVTHNVDEAVYLSDQIMVLSKKPTRILEIFEVTAPRPRDRTSRESNRLRKAVLDLLESEGRRDREAKKMNQPVRTL
jgi:NitT/TauT family transport system ATP-binding protein